MGHLRTTPGFALACSIHSAGLSPPTYFPPGLSAYGVCQDVPTLSPDYHLSSPLRQSTWLIISPPLCCKESRQRALTVSAWPPGFPVLWRAGCSTLPQMPSCGILSVKLVMTVANISQDIAMASDMCSKYSVRVSLSLNMQRKRLFSSSRSPL